MKIGLRKLLGIAAIVVCALILEFYEAPPAMSSFFVGESEYWVPSIGSFLVVTLLFSIGAVIARGHFLPYALVFATVMWVITQYILLSIAVFPEGRPSIASIALSNSPGLLVYWLGAAIGAIAGGRYYTREFESSDNTSRRFS